MVTRQKKARRSSHCGLSSHLLHHQRIFLLGPALTAAAAPQKKVVTTKVQAESRRAAALSDDPWSEPPGRKAIQLAQMTATKHTSLFCCTLAYCVQLYYTLHSILRQFLHLRGLEVGGVGSCRHLSWRGQTHLLDPTWQQQRRQDPTWQQIYRREIRLGSRDIQERSSLAADYSEKN